MKVSRSHTATRARIASKIGGKNRITFENILINLSFTNQFCAFFAVENTETKHGHAFEILDEV